MTRALAWNWLTLWLSAPGGGHFFCTYQPNWTRLGAAAFKMVVGLLPPQLSRFFHTGIVFDTPALPNNCHKHLIIHYCFFLYKYFISYWCELEVGKPVSSTDCKFKIHQFFFFFLLFSLPIDFISLFFFFVHCVSLSLGFTSAFQLQWKTLSPILLHSLANRTHNHMISRSHR